MPGKPLSSATFNHRYSANVLRESVTGAMTIGIVLFLLGVLVTQQFAQRNTLTGYSVIAGAIGLVVTIAALARLSRRLSLPDRLLAQLSAFSEHTNSPHEVLHPLLERNAAGDGWNRLIEQFSDRRDQETIERRVAQGSSEGGSERFARALRSLPEGMAISDHLGKVNYTNAAWAGILTTGAPDQDGLKSNLLAQLESPNFANWQEVQPFILEGTRPSKWELYRSANVHDGVVRLERTPLDGRVGEKAGFVWTLRDITQSVLAREAHEQFLASATHELRTPLTNIRAYSESLLEMDNIQPDQQREFFNVIHSEAGRLGRLLNQLLDIQQLEAGSMTLNVARFDVQRMAHELQEHIDPLVREKKLTFDCRIAPDVKTIQADKEKIISGMVNLLGNAVKYTPEGGEVRLLVEQSEGFVTLAVEDSGIGIAPQELPKIFDRFYRCDDARVADLEGNGLGLAFSMEVAQLHSGELLVESEIDKGSRFTLKLPIGKEPT